MKLYDELKARGLIAQVTNEEEIREMVNNGKATFYIGFDPTADSLHVGHFMALCLMKRLQMAGNQPDRRSSAAAPAMIGDPSGRTDMRKHDDRRRPSSTTATASRSRWSASSTSARARRVMVNNADWLLNLNYIELLREVGACFCGQQYAPRRVLQAAHGKGPELP